MSKLLELAKKNLDGYILVTEALEIISTTQQTPLKHVAQYLLQKEFEQNVPTYTASKYFTLHCENQNWGIFSETNKLLHSLINAKNEIALTFSELSEIDKSKISNMYWEISDLYTLDALSELEIEWHFLLKSIRSYTNYVSLNSDTLKKYKDLDAFTILTLGSLLKEFLPSHIDGNMMRCNHVDAFVRTIPLFYEFGKVTYQELSAFLSDNNIIIQGFNNPLENNINEVTFNENYIKSIELSGDLIELSEDEKLTLLEEDLFNSIEDTTYKNLFYKQDIFDGFEVACLISEYDPNKLTISKTRGVVWRNENPKFTWALNLIMAISKTDNLFNYDENASSYELCYTIENDNLKKYLTNKNIVIQGFNDIEHCNLNRRIEELQNQVVDKNKYIEGLKNSLEKSNHELSETSFDLSLEKNDNKKLKAKLKEIEEQASVTNSNNLLDLIYDEDAQERYAPDLVSSIKLWEHIYINYPNDDSHSNKADTWIKKNTGYDTTKKAGSASKIREITSPFIKWSTHRDKNYKNN